MPLQWEIAYPTWKTFSFFIAMSVKDARPQLERGKCIVTGTAYSATFLKKGPQGRKGPCVSNWIRTEIIYYPNNINIYK